MSGEPPKDNGQAAGPTYLDAPLLPDTSRQPDAEKPKTVQEKLEWMKHDWNERAKENARYYVASGTKNWTDEDFFAAGEVSIAENLVSDLTNVCQGKYPSDMRIIEIGCGAGRLTRALSKLFGEVHAVDVSGEMVAQARVALADRPNVFLYENNGCDLSVLPELKYDFAYSFIVFQHIPSREIVENYVREVGRLLRPGALFKFQLQGFMALETLPMDTWYGAPFSESQTREMAERCGFEMRFSAGAGEQYFWLWFFKKPVPGQ
jgi:SAM-dependent methyltransferase